MLADGGNLPKSYPATSIELGTTVMADDPVGNNLSRCVRSCLLYTSDAADERSSVALGGRRILKKKKHTHHTTTAYAHHITQPTN